MVTFLLKNYRSIVTLVLLLLAICLHAFAVPTPTCPIVTERFQGLTDGTTSNNSSTGWNLDAFNVTGGYFAVKSNRFHAQEIGGEGRWYSKVFSVAAYSDFQVAVKVSSEGDMNSSEYVKIYYKLNGGTETLLSSRTGNFGTIDFISPTLTANNVQIIVKLYNYNNGGSQTSKYYIEEYRVFKEHGPCSGGSIPVAASAGNGGVLTCSNPSLTVSATTTATGTTTWSWTGPNSFTSTSQNPSVSAAGTYTVVGTNAAGSGTATVTVSENKAAPIVTATGGNLACASSIVISATSSISGSTFSWTGPGGFTSNSQNPSVSAVGSYTVTVTNPANGCSTSQSVSVTAGAATPSNLWTESFTLTNNTTASGTWSSTTPAGTFSVQSNEFRVNNIGTSGEGVWSSGSISIAGKASITISAGVRSGVSSGGALENSGSSLDYVRFYYKLNNGSETLFSENLGTINSNSATNTTVSVGSISGSTLEIIIRARTTASDELYYFDNISVTGINAAATITPTVTGTVTCVNSAQLSATVSGGSVTSYAWTGPNGFTSSIQNPVVTAGGQYTVTATLSSGGCSVTAPITVPENKAIPDIIASGGALACLPGITLSAISSVPGATYSWTGPGGFTSTLQNPTVTAAGIYTLMITNPFTGCTGTDTALVNQNGAPPANVSIISNTGSNELTCLVGGLTLTGSSSTPGSTYTWTIPNGITVAGTVTSATQEGNYIFTATNPANSCTTTSTFTVVRNMSTPVNGSIAGGNQYLTCINPGATLTASNSLSGVVYNWIGPNGFTAAGPVATVTAPGFYNVIMTHPVTGCNHSIGAAIFVDTTSPANLAISTSSANSQITCTNNNVQVTASSSTSGTIYEWSGPDGFTGSSPTVSLNQPGNYILRAINPANGCIATRTRIIEENRVLPANITAAATTNGGQLTCAVTSIALAGGSSTPGVTYAWSAPGFSASGQNTSVNTATTYTLMVTDPSNGCNASATVTVTSNTNQPAGVSATFSETLTCLTTSVDLTGNSSTPGVTYLWTGPSGFSSLDRVTQTGVAGTYQLRVTNPGNGCFRTVSTTVEQDIEPPADITADNTGPLTCSTTSVLLIGSTSASDVDYLWTGPDNFVSFLPTANVSVPGVYTLTVTDLVTNGCSGTATTTVDIVQCGGGDSRMRPTGNNARLSGAAVSEITSSGKFEYKAYPNPFNQRLLIEFQAPENDFVSIEFYNSVGVVQQVLFHDHVVAGRLYKINMDGNRLPQGVYYYIIKTGSKKVYPGKLLLVR
jgi:hypothetical protein